MTHQSARTSRRLCRQKRFRHGVAAGEVRGGGTALVCARRGRGLKVSERQINILLAGGAINWRGNAQGE